jgi:iron complex transport system substrate-binding protein
VGGILSSSAIYLLYNMKRLILFIGIALAACKADKSAENKATSSPNRYALGFTVTDKGAYRDVVVRHATDTTVPSIRYRLVEKGQTAPTEAGVTNIQVPIESIVCTSTTHIPHLDYLNESQKLIGFPSIQYVSSPAVRQLIDAGKVQELGKDNGLNLELIAQLKPSVVMAYTMSKDLGQLKKVKELGIPVVVNAEFLEQHPLGRAEWLKFTGMLLGKEKEADSIFRYIETEYLKTKALADGFSEKPTVFTGIPYGGIWYMPGGQNYGARFFTDAGCQYLWGDDPSTGFLQLSLEAVYEKAASAEYWIGVASFTEYASLKTTDARFADFAAFKNKKIYHYNGRMGATGGNEYFELAYLRPDLLLKDLIQITHPNAYPNPELYFYRKVE